MMILLIPDTPPASQGTSLFLIAVFQQFFKFWAFVQPRSGLAGIFFREPQVLEDSTLGANMMKPSGFAWGIS